jgi:alkaline phosphatase D
MNFPHERQRLLDLIKETKATGVMFLTGDRHHAEISRLADGVGYPIYDITAGPLNGNSKWQNEINRHRLGSVLFEPNFGALSINWEESNPDINVYILDAKGNIKINTNLRLNDLRPAEAAPVAAP